MQSSPSLNLNDVLAAELRAAAARKSLSTPAIGRNVDWPPMYVYRRLTGMATISVEDLVVLSRGIGVEPLDVLAQALANPDVHPAVEPVVAGT